MCFPQNLAILLHRLNQIIVHEIIFWTKIYFFLAAHVIHKNHVQVSISFIHFSLKFNFYIYFCFPIAVL